MSSSGIKTGTVEFMMRFYFSLMNSFALIAVFWKSSTRTGSIRVIIPACAPEDPTLPYPPGMRTFLNGEGNGPREYAKDSMTRHASLKLRMINEVASSLQWESSGQPQLQKRQILSAAAFGCWIKLSDGKCMHRKMCQR